MMSGPAIFALWLFVVGAAVALAWSFGYARGLADGFNDALRQYGPEFTAARVRGAPQAQAPP